MVEKCAVVGGQGGELFHCFPIMAVDRRSDRCRRPDAVRDPHLPELESTRVADPQPPHLIIVYPDPTISRPHQPIVCAEKSNPWVTFLCWVSLIQNRD